MSYTVKAGGNQYFRLRGTNLGTDVPNETAAGEPLPDVKTDVVDNIARFNAITRATTPTCGSIRTRCS
nr:hypothetical protein [Variovorax sp. E3]